MAPSQTATEQGGVYVKNLNQNAIICFIKDNSPSSRYTTSLRIGNFSALSHHKFAGYSFADNL
jgi:hypothetical protein